MKYLPMTILCLVTILSGSLSANAWERSLLLRCKTADHASLSDTGLLEKTNNFFLSDEEFTVDLETGMVRHDNKNGAIYNVIQKGSAENDTVLSLPVKSMVDNVIRIRDWESSRVMKHAPDGSVYWVDESRKHITFVKFSFDSVMTGICVPIK